MLKVLVDDDHGYKQWLVLVDGCSLGELREYVRSLFKMTDYTSAIKFLKALPYMGVDHLVLPVVSTDDGLFVLKEEHVNQGDVDWSSNPEMYRPMTLKNEGISSVMSFD